MTSRGSQAVILGLIGLTLVKLLVASVWGWTNDIPQTLVQAKAFLESPHFLRPESPSIFPLGYYLLATAPLVASLWTGFSYAFWLKVPAIVADLVIALALRTMPRGGDRAAFLYMLNPVTFLLSVYHGQLHTVATACAVLALRYADSNRAVGSGVALGLAASVRQHFGLLVLPLVLHNRTRRRAMLMSFGLVVALSNITLWSGWYQDRLATPVWAYGAWGYGMLLLQGPRLLALLGFSGMASVTEGVNHALQWHGPKLYWIWTALFWGWIWHRHQRRQAPDLWRSALVFLLGLYAISPGFGVQWLIWAVPCWLIVDRPGALRYSALAGAFLAGSYWQWSLNAKYGVPSITANLSLLTRVDLVGVFLVGVCSLLAWLYCVRATWRLAWAVPSTPFG